MTVIFYLSYLHRLTIEHEISHYINTRNIVAFVRNKEWVYFQIFDKRKSLSYKRKKKSLYFIPGRNCLASYEKIIFISFKEGIALKNKKEEEEERDNDINPSFSFLAEITLQYIYIYKVKIISSFLLIWKLSCIKKPKKKNAQKENNNETKEKNLFIPFQVEIALQKSKKFSSFRFMWKLSFKKKTKKKKNLFISFQTESCLTSLLK